MTLVKVIRNGQITLPADLREKMAIKEGDYLEAEIIEDQIILRPKVIIDKRQAIHALHSIMDKIQSRTIGIEPEIIEQEVEETIQEIRKQKHA